MVVRTNSAPPGIPNLVFFEEGNYSVKNCSIVIQHGCEVALGAWRLWAEAPLCLDSSALLLDGLFCSALRWSALLCAVLIYSPPIQ